MPRKLEARIGRVYDFLHRAGFARWQVNMLVVGFTCYSFWLLARLAGIWLLAHGIRHEFPDVLLWLDMPALVAILGSILIVIGAPSPDNK